MLRKTSALLAATGLVLAHFASPVNAQTANFPHRPITVVVGIQAGSGTDQAARVVSKRLSERLGQAVIIDNKPGAGGTLGAAAVARAAPDGYTLLWAGSALPIYPHTHGNLRFDPVKDLVPVAMATSGTLALVTRADSPYKTIADIVAKAKAQPGSVTYASSGVGSNSHLSAEVFQQLAGVKFVHVAYKGSSAALMDVMSGQIDFVFDGMPSVVPNVKSGRVRALAVTMPHRSTLMPEIPSMDEAGVKGFSHPTWAGYFAPKGTPKAVLDLLAMHVNAIVAQPDFAKDLAVIGMEPNPVSPEVMGSLLQKETEDWGRKIKKMNIEMEK